MSDISEINTVRSLLQLLKNRSEKPPSRNIPKVM